MGPFLGATVRMYIELKCAYSHTISQNLNLVFLIPVCESKDNYSLMVRNEKYYAGMYWAPFTHRREHGSLVGLGEKLFFMFSKSSSIGGRVKGTEVTIKG